jgi:hypothetical protein
MLWRKVFDHNPQFVVFSDKLATKEYVREKCPGLAVPRTRWVGGDVDEIPVDMLKGDVFVKANHGCRYNFRIQNGAFDRAALRREAWRWMRSRWGRKHGEWAYSEVVPKLFVEDAVGFPETGMLEINVRACNGRPLLGSVAGKVNIPGHWVIYMDPEGNLTPGMDDPEGVPIAGLPEGAEVKEPYRQAVEFTKKLSVGVDYARFDFMWNGKELFAGEITVYPGAGSKNPANSFVDRVLLSGWDLMQSHFLKTQHTGWRRRYAEALRRSLSTD